MLIRIADIVFQINTLYEETGALLKDYIIKDSTSIPDEVLSYNYEDIASEQLITGQGSVLKLPSFEMRFFNREKHEFYAIHRKIANVLPHYSAFLMHGAAIAKDGYSYLFTAPSGVGKTTRVNLWKEEYPDSIILNGDKPIIKVTESEVLACGSPWCGKEGINANIMVPLRAIFLLERSNEDSIEEIGFGEALAFLLKQTYMPPQAEALHDTFLLLKALANRVKIYRFYSTPTRNAIRLAYKVTQNE